MDERLKELLESDEWAFPPWPDLLGPPMNLVAVKSGPGRLVPVGAPGAGLRLDRSVPVPENEETPDRSLPEELRKPGAVREIVEAYFENDIEVVTEATKEALRRYLVEVKLDFDRKGELRDARKMAAQGRQLLKLSKALKQASKQLAKIGDDGQERMTRGLGPGWRVERAEFMQLEDLLPDASVAARAAAWMLGVQDLPRSGSADENKKPALGRPVEVVRPRLVYRLHLVWERFADVPISHWVTTGVVDSWPFGDFVDPIVRRSSGKSGDRYAKTLVAWKKSQSQSGDITKN